MSNIKTLNELRKLIRDTKWLEMKFTKDELNQFNYKLDDEGMTKGFTNIIKLQGSNEYVFNKHRFDHRIDKKKQADVYKLRLLTIKDRWDNRSLYHENQKIMKDKSIKAFTIYEFVGHKDSWSSFSPSSTLFWVNDYSDEILYVKYNRKDTWFNNFFRNELDKSISNNFEELFSEKQFNLLYEQRFYKVYSVSALDYEMAKEKLEKEHEQLKWISGRKQGRWDHLGRCKVDKTPEGTFDANDLLESRVY